MRFIAATAGIVMSVPPLFFFWIGSQTFVQGAERALANVITIESAALLALSVALLFTPSAQRIQLLLLLVTSATLAAVAVAIRLFK